MLVDEKYLSCFDSDNIDIFAIKDYIGNVVDRILFISSVSDSVSYWFE